jgi:hypothetical protein
MTTLLKGNIMPFGRKIEIRLVKDAPKSADNAAPVEPPVDYIAFAKDATKRLVIGACVVIATTVVLTAAAEIATSHLTPNQN